MALENIGSIKAISVPTWLKVVIGILLLSALVADVSIAWVAISNPLRKDWFSAAIQLLGSLLPLLIVILLFSFTSSGPTALTRKTSDVLVKLIPHCFRYAATPTPQFQSLQRAKIGGRFEGFTDIQIAYHPGDFFCRYKITFPDTQAPPEAPVKRTCFFVIDLKVHQANMGLCVQRENLDKYCEAHGYAGDEQRHSAFKEAFRHTLTGAEKAGCLINDTVTEIVVADKHLSCLVVVRVLSEDFFGDPTEQLFLAQDLTAMLRSFWRERPDWFPSPPA